MCGGWIGNALDDIGDAVRDVVDWTGDAIEDVGDAVGDAVDWVVDGVEDVIDGLLDDPVKTIATAAALIIPGGAAYIPLINAVDAIEEGADPFAVVASLVLPTVVGELTSAVNLADAIGSTASNIVTDTAVNVATTGGDIGAIILGEIAEQAPFVNDFISSIVDTTINTLGVDTSTIAGQTFASNLNNVATAVLTAEVSGGDGLQAGTMAVAAGAGKSMLDSIGGDTLTEEQSNNISTVLAAGFQAGDNAADAMSAAAEEIGQEALKEGVSNFFSSDEQVEEVVGGGIGEDVKKEIEEFQDATAGEVKVEELEDPELDARIPEGIQDPSEIEPVPEEIARIEEFDPPPEEFDAPSNVVLPEITDAPEITSIPEELETKDDVPEFMDSDYLEFLEDISDAGEPVSQLDDSVLDMPAPPDVEIEDTPEELITDDPNPRIGYESFDDLLQSKPNYVLDPDATGTIDVSTLDMEEELYGEPKVVLPPISTSDVYSGKTFSEQIGDGLNQYKTDLARGADTTADNYLKGLEAIALTGGSLWFDTPEELLAFAKEGQDKFIFEGPSATAEFINSQGEGYNWGKLDNAVLEQGANLFASAVSALGITAATGNPLLGLLGPAAVEGLQIVGPIALDRAKRNGRDAPNQSDWLYATGGAFSSGALNAIPFFNKVPGVQNLITRAGNEFGTEAIQEAIQQYAVMADVPLDSKAFRDLENNYKEFFGAGLIGGTTTVAIDPVVSAIEAGVDALTPEQDIPQGIQDPSEIPLEVGTTTQSDLEIAEQALINQGVTDPDLINQVLEEAGLIEVTPDIAPEVDTTTPGIIEPTIEEILPEIDAETPTSPAIVNMAGEINATGGTNIDTVQQVQNETGLSLENIDNIANELITITDTNKATDTITNEIEETGGLSLETAKDIENNTNLSMTNINDIAINTLEDTGISEEVTPTDIDNTNEIISAITGTSPENVTDAEVEAVTDAVAVIDSIANQDAKPETLVDSIVDPIVDPKVTVNPIVTDMGEEEPEELKEKEKSLQQTGRVATLAEPEYADIDYLYDFESIFANPEQEKLFTTFDNQYTNINNPLKLGDTTYGKNYVGNPYARFEDETTNKLLGLLGGKV